MAISEEWLRVMEVVDPGYSPAKAPVIEVINMLKIITIMMGMMKVVIKSMTQELAGAKMQLLRRNQEELGKVR